MATQSSSTLSAASGTYIKVERTDSIKLSSDFGMHVKACVLTCTHHACIDTHTYTKSKFKIYIR